MIKSITQTCDACPSQWEIELKDGRWVYARYRWGNIGFGIGNTIDKAINNYSYGEDIGDEMDGMLDTESMLAHLKTYLENL